MGANGIDGILYQRRVTTMKKLTTICFLVLGLYSTVRPGDAWSITLGQIDDFEDGTVQGWVEGRPSPNPTTNIGIGGNPGGYLDNVSSGRGRAGSRLAQFNQAQWTGNYLDAGVSSIEIDMKQFGGTSSLPMRIAIEGPGFTRYGSADPFTLPADDQWHSVTFGLSDADLVREEGNRSLEEVLSSVVELRIVAARTAPVWRSFSVAAHLGMDNITAVGAAAELQAGDSDQDLDFDQLDLVQVQIAAKYLTGQPATWGEGDWNGAPGGSQGAPPAGDGQFNQFDIIAAQQAGIYLTGPYAAVAPGGQRSDAQTSIIYNANSGEVSVNAPAGTELTSINIDSAAGIFTGAPAENLGGSFDNDSDTNIFKATFGSSFGSLSLGPVAQSALDEAFLLDDLTVVGSLAGGGGLGEVDLIYVPEPASLQLIGLALFTFCSPIVCRSIQRRRLASLPCSW